MVIPSRSASPIEPKVSIDYEVVEKEPLIGAVFYKGMWKDLGTWNTFTEEMNDHAIDRHVLLSENCQNTHVLNMLDIPLIVQDVSDAVVVASYDGILVSSKQGSSLMKPLVDHFNLRPMYEQRSWGNYRILGYKQSDDASMLVKHISIEAGRTISGNHKDNCGQTWVVIKGKGILTVNGADSVVAPNNVISFPSEAELSVLAATELEIIEVQFGAGELKE